MSGGQESLIAWLPTQCRSAPSAPGVAAANARGLILDVPQLRLAMKGRLGLLRAVV
jgi:hypothetical protein